MSCPKTAAASSRNPRPDVLLDGKTFMGAIAAVSCKSGSASFQQDERCGHRAKNMPGLKTKVLK
jgi:hypothetical protein